MSYRFFFVITFLMFFTICSADKPAANSTYNLRLLTGKAIQEIIPFLVAQRIEMYREYPYLYEGSRTVEEECLQQFAQLPSSAVAIAYLDDEPVGFIIGASLADYDQHFIGSIEAFKSNGKNPNEYYYFADVLILPAHKGKSLATRLFALFEEYCANLGFLYACFVSESHVEHPLKPIDYNEVDLIWQHYGYQKSNIKIYFSWNTIQPDGPAQEQLHELPYWIKKLN